MQKEKIYNEMMVHVGVNTHKEPKDVLVVSESCGFIDEIKRHECVENLVVIKDGELELQDSAKFDLVLVDAIMTSEKFFDEVSRVLRADGVMISDGGSYITNLEEHKELLKVAGKNFYIAMPYNYSCKLGTFSLICASKKYHPTADINLQRADLMDGLKYYNSDVHVASFVKPTYVFKALLGIAKN